MTLMLERRSTRREAAEEIHSEARMENQVHHRAVMVKEVVAYLQVRPGRKYIDGTVGEGGHARAILQTCTPGGHILGLDVDSEALKKAEAQLSGFEGSFTLLCESYTRMVKVCLDFGIAQVDGVFLDLGMSSFQLEVSGRGFSFMRDELLDMRFDIRQELTADVIVNTYSEREMADILFKLGEEPKARAIAQAIVKDRPIRTTGQLARLVEQVAGHRGKIHPATRTFQALRIAVNGELENIDTGLAQAISVLKPGGVLAVISYHSLEDRIVKQTFQREARGCICPPGLPACQCGHRATLRLVTKKVVRPSYEEVRANPRSRSARMRVAERVYDQGQG